MQPQNPYGQTPGPAPGVPRLPTTADYDFILNGPKVVRGGGLSGGGKKKSWLLIGGLVVVLLGLGLYLLFGRSSGSSNVDLLVKTAQRQTEIVRVAGLALGQNSASQDTKNVAMNTSLTVGSDLKQVKDYLSKSGHGVKDKTLIATKDSKTDTKITDASASGTLDSVYNQILKDELAAYQSDLTQAYKATKGQNGQKVLSTAYDNVQLLTKQLK